MMVALASLAGAKRLWRGNRPVPAWINPQRAYPQASPATC